MTYWKCFRFLATLVVCGTQLGNYAVKIIKMTLDIWNTPSSVKICLHLSQWGKNYCNYIFLGNFSVRNGQNYSLLSNRIDLKLVALDSHSNYASFDVFEVYFKQNSENNIFTFIFATFYFEIAVKWSEIAN